MRTHRQPGFTLVEMIMVIVITGIIGSMVAVFLRAPIQQYMDVARRAELTDIADTAFQRLSRDIRTAVPNSVSSPSATYVEFLPTITGGRYRATSGVGGCGATGNELTFASTPADTCFEVIGPTVSVRSNDYLVVGSTQSDAGPAYDLNGASGVLRQIASSGVVQTILFTSNNPLPAFAQLDSQRFQVVDGTQQAVTYACAGTQLIRYWRYGFAHILTGAQSAVLADNIGSCNFVYDIVNQRNGLVAITLQITKDGEQVNLYEEIHVNNAP